MTVFVSLTALVGKVRDSEGSIQTESFLAICRQIIPITEKFGASFALIKSDIGGNIDRLEEARQKDPQKYQALFSIPLDEISRGSQGDKYSDSRALLWLKRAMEFIEALLQLLYKDRDITMSAAASQAYYATLYNFHTWYTSAAFQLALKLVPSRESFFEKLEVTSEEGLGEMNVFLEAFSPLLAEIQAFLKSNGLDDPTPV